MNILQEETTNMQNEYKRETYTLTKITEEQLNEVVRRFNMTGNSVMISQQLVDWIEKTMDKTYDELTLDNNYRLMIQDGLSDALNYITSLVHASL